MSATPLRDRVGAVLIGRNEGDRLARALRAAVSELTAVVYVDSGSSDDSVAMARSMGVEVVALDLVQPFTAARARNAGYERLRQRWPAMELVQFIDGDCELAGGWITAAAAAMDADTRLAAVFGRRRERHPEASVYNRLIDLEWDTPVGPATACGGDVMLRVEALQQAGPYDATIAAGEEPELCMRLRAAGWSLQRIDHDMTLHDAAITRLSQWWRRDVRTGRGSLDVASRFGHGSDNPFGPIVARTRRWALGWPLAVLGCTLIAGMIGGAVVAAIALVIVVLMPLAQMARQALSGHRRGLGWSDAMRYAWLGFLGKFAQMQGQLQYLRDRARGRTTVLVEYKAPQPAASGRAQV